MIGPLAPSADLGCHYDSTRFRLVAAVQLRRVWSPRRDFFVCGVGGQEWMRRSPAPPAYHKADGVSFIPREASQRMHRLICKCGSVSGQVREGTPSNHLRCYCSDCQAFGRFFGPDAGVLDRKGGTEIVQVSQSRVQIERGLDQLACMRLSPKGLLRWYARCCNTPIGNTLANPSVSVIGLIHTCLDAAILERNFGLSTADVNTDAAIGPGKPTQHGLLSTIGKVLVMVLTDRITGRYRKSPFFSEAGKPVVEPRVLSSDEVALVKRTT